jgi:hypothetical protein
MRREQMDSARDYVTRTLSPAFRSSNEAFFLPMRKAVWFVIFYAKSQTLERYTSAG